MSERYLTPRSAGKKGPLSETQLRLMIKQGRCPGFYIGATKKHFLVDYVVLVEQLERESREAMRT